MNQHLSYYKESQYQTPSNFAICLSHYKDILEGLNMLGGYLKFLFF